jgi:two-component system, LytTR family, sensor kinase
VGAGAWCVLVALFSAQAFSAGDRQGGPLGWRSTLFEEAVGWGVWLALTPAIVRLCQRFPVRTTAAPRQVLVHVAAAFALATLQSLAVAVVCALYYYRPSVLATSDIFRDRLHTVLAVNMLVYLVIAASVHAVSLAREAARREVLAATLEARAARGELAALYAQLQPHFLFNTFNSITELVHAEPERASRMIRTLSELLRHTLTPAGDLAVPLRDELAFTRRYVELQQMRFRRLEFCTRVEGPALDARVPRLLLQPLVENAIRYTVGLRGHGRVEVIAACVRDRLRVSVADDGPGFGATDGHAGAGAGLAITRARLDRLYAGRYALELGSAPAGGAVVVLDLPLVGGAPSPVGQ